MLTIKGEATEQSNFHLVPHFEECSASATINCVSSVFGNFMQHLELATRGRADEPACSYSQWLECWKVRFLQGFSFINCILAYHLFSWNSTHGTHHPGSISTVWNSLDYSFLHNCEELSSNSEKCVFLIPSTSYEDPTCICMRFHFQCSPELCRTPEIKRSVSSTRWIP